MKWIELNRSKIKVFGKPAKVMMKGMTASEEHTHFLHSLLTNNIKALKPGEFNYNLWLRQNGQPVGDFFVYKVSDYYILDTERPPSEVIEDFNKLKLSLRVYFEDLTPNLRHLFLFGEGVEELLEERFGNIPEDFKLIEKEGSFIASNPVRLGVRGYDFLGDPSLLGEFLSEEGRLSTEEFEDIRINNCIPKIGKELKEGFSPLEAGVLSYAIDMNKGCYVGQEAIARVYFRGRTPRILVKLSVLESNPREGEKLFEGSKSVGVITSLSSDGRTALGYLLRACYEEGKELSTGGAKLRVERTCGSSS